MRRKRVFGSVLVSWLAAACLHAAAGSAAPAEFRGIWVDAFGPGFFSTNEVKQLVADCRRYNFNAVLVEMRRRGDAFYLPRSPNPDPRTIALSNSFDSLAELINQCHTGTPRIEVHCWLVSHLVWAWKKPPVQPTHVFNLHPDYFTTDSLGQRHIANGYYLDPGHPDANQWLHDVAIDIVTRYDIDGIHWDYCRYPSRDAGYNATALRRYNAEFQLGGEPSPGDPRFCEWRRRQITDFLRWVNADLLQIKPALVTSVAVLADPTDAYGHRFQDWAVWNAEGLLDVCMPMVFATNNQHLFLPRLQAAATNAGIRYVYPGQAAYMNRFENTLAQLQQIRTKGFPGRVLYSYRNSNEGQPVPAIVFSGIREKFQPEWTATPILPWKSSKAIIKGTVTSGSQPVYNATVTIDTSPNRSQKTEPHGSYAFFDIDPGSYTIAASAGQLRADNKLIQVKAGQVVAVNFDLSETNRIARSEL